MSGTVVPITGASGTTYWFRSVGMFFRLPLTAGGVYLFARKPYGFLSGLLGPQVLYVGQAAWFESRPLGPGHHRWDHAVRAGMDDVLVLEVADEFERLRIERDIIDGLHPPLNG